MEKKPITTKTWQDGTWTTVTIKPGDEGYDEAHAALMADLADAED